MAFDGFIKLSSIEGESTDAKHPGWIEIADCSMEISQEITASTSSPTGAAVGRADLSDLRFTKQMDKSSPLLALACAEGDHFDTVTVSLCRAGTEKVGFMEFKLSHSLISSIVINAGGDFPTETIHLNYSAVQWCYTQQGRQGGGARGNVVAGWDRRRNCKV